MHYMCTLSHKPSVMGVALYIYVEYYVIFYETCIICADYCIICGISWSFTFGRPYRGDIKRNDPQRKLTLPPPLLPSRRIPAGFLGYAVNMIDVDVHQLNTRTAAGYGLRETLFYRLFGETQVYDTREHMRRANACINHGALSLDGGIMRDNGIILLGDQ